MRKMNFGFLKSFSLFSGSHQKTSISATSFNSLKTLETKKLFSNSSTKTSRLEPSSAPNLTAIGIRKIFNEEHDLFRESCRKFFSEHVVPYHEKWEQEQVVSREIWQLAGKAGLLGANAPTEYGGSGAGILASAIVWEEQSYSNCSGPGFALHSDIVIPYLLKYGTEQQKTKYVPPMIEGKIIGAIAMTEPGVGSDLAAVSTNAIRQGDQFILNGQKTFITNGQLADIVIVVAKTKPEKGAHGISLLIVERGMSGFERGRNLKKMGLKAQDTSELFFDNVKVPVTNLLGEENKGFYMLMQELPQERLLVADMSLATGEAAFEWTRKYTKERKAFGKPISEFQVTRHKLAEMKTELVIGRTFADHCLELHNEKKLDTQTASMAKYWLTDLEGKVVDQCVQLFGGYGFMWEYPISKAYVDARVQRIYAGTNEIMKEIISKSI